MRVSQEDNEPVPNLYIEFEDEHSAPPPTEGAGKQVSDPEAIGVAPTAPPRRWWPEHAWAAVPARYRKVVAGVVALVGLGAAIGDSLAAQAAQQAADRSSVAVVDAAYSPSIDGQGLVLLVDVANSGHTTLTLTQAQVDESDLNLHYSGQPLNMSRSQQVELVLWGRYDCTKAATSRSDKAPTTSKGVLHLTLHNVHGDVTTVDASLPPSAQLPDHWDSGRAAYCAWVWSGGFDG